MEKNSLSMPISIVIAGVIIAGAVYFSNINRPAAPAGNGGDANGGSTILAEAALDIKPVSDSDYIVGNPNAPFVIVEYSDTECPFCKNFHVSLNRLITELGKDGKVAWVYRHFPLWKSEAGYPALHPAAEKEARAFECAGKLGGNTKFWEYANRLYSVTPSNNQLDPAELPKIAIAVGLNEAAFNTCLSSGEFAAKVDGQYEDAKSVGASGTPFSIIIARDPLDRGKVEKTFKELAVKFGSRTENFAISADNRRIAMNGAQPYEIVKGLIEALQP